MFFLLGGWRWGFYQIPPDLFVSGRFTNPGQVDVFLFQVLPDIVHLGLPLPPSAFSNPSSCKSFLVSCQVVTNPLLVGQGGRWVPKDLFRPKVSFQHMPPALASFSGFLVSLSTSRSALRGSSVSDLHP